MNRAPAIVLAVLMIAAGIVVALLLMRFQNLPDGAQAALSGYLQYRQPLLSPQTLSIAQAAYSGNPSRFHADMSGASFGDSRFYQTSYSYHAESVVNLTFVPTTPPQDSTLTLSDSLKITAFRSNGGIPIPFPPVELWCVALNEDAKTPSVVFVAFHRDLYYADWLVHEPPAYANTGELNNRLAGVDCNLELGRAH
jgi:hypothetical protein